MEIGQIQCDNLGMTQDTDVSKLSKDQNGVTNYAFENYNIRIMAVNDTTKFAVTNEKSTKNMNQTLSGTFLGSCKLNRYVVIFTTNSSSTNPDYIYRIEYINNTTEDRLDVVTLYNGNLGFDTNHPIEAIGYYESEDIQKVYWVDGLNQNRFINIAKKEVNAYILDRLYNKYTLSGNTYSYRDGKVYELKVVGASSGNLYVTDLDSIEQGTDVFKYDTIIQYTSKRDLETMAVADYHIQSITYAYDYNNNSFDFQGHINSIPTVVIEKDYNQAGYFVAGTLQYFISYYNKYGVETGIIWNSDLQYISLSNRGAKADEAVSCGFNIQITNIDNNYDYLRIYACYRSGINGATDARIVADLSLEDKSSTDTITYIDLGTTGSKFNAVELKYIGGQKIIANTLDYKQNTAFFGDITITSEVTNLEFPKTEVLITDLKTAEYPNGQVIQSTNAVNWVYKYVSPIATEGVYQYDSEINQSQEEIAGFKWRELYRFGIQFMTAESEWTPAYWLGDKYCGLKPTVFTVDPNEENVQYTKAGCYIASAVVDIDAINSVIQGKNYIAYRLLVADTNISNRRIVSQGVINPTMFNYVDRISNRPFSIPSYIFRPRESKITNRHYDTLPKQTADNAELQGIEEKQIPGFKGTIEGANYDSYLFIIASNAGTLDSGYIQWKLIYYDSKGELPTSGFPIQDDSLTKAEKLYLFLYSGEFKEGTSLSEIDAVYDKVARLMYKHKIGWVKLRTENAPHSTNTAVRYDDYPVYAECIAYIKSLLGNGYVPINIYGANYKVVSSGLENYYRVHNAQGPLSKWTSLRGWLIAQIYKDMQSTTAEDVGDNLAGKIVLTEANLPSADLLKRIGTENSDGAVVGAAILATLTAAAAVVISALSFGTLAIPAAMAVGAAASFAASVAVGAASAAASLDLASQNLPDLAKEMLAMGYSSPNDNNNTNLSSRKERSKEIGKVLEKYFTVDGYTTNSNTLGFRWEVPVLKGDPNRGHTSPFKTGHPYTDNGCIGEDYNAFIMGGKLTALEPNDIDKLNKQNVFCIDESIVTLNTPDVEDNASTINNSEALKLDLVGTIPVDATYGMYDLEVSNGLNSNSQVLRDRFKINSITDSSRDAIGMLNGDIYQDFFSSAWISEETPFIQVNEGIGVYRVFMWNKESSVGFWLPGITLKDGFGEIVTSPRSNLIHKVFANLRYSTNTNYFTPFNIEIEPPQVCLDSQTMLKAFKYANDYKNYYENVDTISVNNSPYNLVVNNGEYPTGHTSDAEIKDPIHIKYRQTPHILIPFAWNKSNNSSTILPYLRGNKQLLPSSLYDDKLEGKLDGIQLYGTTDSMPLGEEYYYLDNSTEQRVPNRKYIMHHSSEELIISYEYEIWVGQENTYRSIVDSLPLNTIIFKKESVSSGLLVLMKYYVTISADEERGVDHASTVAMLSSYINNNLTIEPLESTWNQKELNWDVDSSIPYLFLGELIKKDFLYSTWNGGHSKEALQQLNWNVASKVTPIDKDIEQSWGDTFYQRWDCEKTYPFTEDDKNSNVEILSFMVESHTNLDGRCDVNRGINNLLNTRPSNTLFNPVYSQKDNFFSYQTLDDRFEVNHFKSDIVWSLSKINVDTIDKWTNLLATNEMSLDGRYGTVRKILNVNDNLITFQDSAISSIKFNESSALTTTSGLPLQLGNTGKVDGYRIISDTTGCHNKFSISKNSAGVFFIDDYNKAFKMFTNEGAIDAGSAAEFSQWFKDNITGDIWNPTNEAFRSSYDEITHDLYLINRSTCLVYNTLLHRFTSFMGYVNTPYITNMISENGKADSFTFRSYDGNVQTYKLFGDDSYGTIYGQFIPYSIEYRLNPDPMHDSIFTNYEYSADWIDPDITINEHGVFNDVNQRYTTFDTVKAWNEYQHGIMNIPTKQLGRAPIKSKFRIWRGDIPRDGYTTDSIKLKGDRMRNPWIHLKFKKETADESKMIFHNLTVTYYNQYGRI